MAELWTAHVSLILNDQSYVSCSFFCRDVSPLLSVGRAADNPEQPEAGGEILPMRDCQAQIHFYFIALCAGRCILLQVVGP